MNGSQEIELKTQKRQKKAREALKAQTKQSAKAKLTQLSAHLADLSPPLSLKTGSGGPITKTSLQEYTEGAETIEWAVAYVKEKRGAVAAKKAQARAKKN